MTRRWVLGFSLVSSFLMLGAVHHGSAGTVTLSDGRTLEGDVIVREFDEVYVTIVNDARRKLHQFTASKVKSVSSTIDNIVVQDTPLKSEAGDNSSTVVALTAGQELKILGEEKDEWIHVQAWGTNTGWVPKIKLTDLVIQRKEDDKVFFAAPPKKE